MQMSKLMRPIIFSLFAIALLVGAGCSSEDKAAEPTATESDSSGSIQVTNQANQDQDMKNREERPSASSEPVGILPDERIKNKVARITMPKGEIIFELYAEDAPKTVSNFVALAESGFYDGLTFHRVEPGFVIQGGDPQGTGRGGPGYRFEDEPVTREYLAGTVAMANAGPDTNGSQFFVCLEDLPNLPKAYTIFGQVIEGMDVVRSVEVGDVMTEVSIEDKAQAL